MKERKNWGKHVNSRQSLIPAARTSLCYLGERGEFVENVLLPTNCLLILLVRVYMFKGKLEQMLVYTPMCIRKLRIFDLGE